MTTRPSWDHFEEKVRNIASIKWNAPCIPKQIAGVNVDGVIDSSDSMYVCIEITERNDLQKVRDDISKLSSVRHGLFQDNIFAICYVVMEGEPTSSMQQTGAASKINVVSYETFEALVFNYKNYIHQRKNNAFGSAIDPVEGKPDETPYIPVRYDDLVEQVQYTIHDIHAALISGKNVILIGEYGTGKSRCVKELFELFSKQAAQYCLSIDLRDHYGAKRATDIIRRHLDDLGLSSEADGYIKIFKQNQSILLLDGFDEIATSQPWSSEASRLRELRKHALQGVKDTITQKTGGVLISGRPHYFDSDEEMFQSLGLDHKNTLVLNCATEFTKDEMSNYLKSLAGTTIKIPNWLPRKPLVCHVIKSLEQDQLKRLSEDKGTERDFWSLLIDLICKREAKINPFLDEESIHKVLIEISALTRKKNGNIGPLSLFEMEGAFEKATGCKPSEASATMLNRLMTLGRTSAQNSDRQFVDLFILDGLRAEHTAECMSHHDDTATRERWINPLYPLGMSILAGRLTGSQKNSILNYVKKSSVGGNSQLAIDVICSLLEDCDEVIFENTIFINSVHIPQLCLSGKRIKGINFSQCIIDDFIIDSVNAENVLFKDNHICQLYGVSAERGLPDWIKKNGNKIESFEQISTQKRIGKASLNENQKVFLEIVNRTFFQPGAARQENSLYGGFSASKEMIVTRILSYLVKNKILETHKDSQGKLYRPNRSYMHRLKTIRSQLTLSDDEIWHEISKLKI